MFRAQYQDVNSPLIYRLNVMPIKNPSKIFINISTVILKCTQKHKATKIFKGNSESNIIGEPTLPDFKGYYKATVPQYSDGEMKDRSSGAEYRNDLHIYD